MTLLGHGSADHTAISDCRNCSVLQNRPSPVKKPVPLTDAQSDLVKRHLDLVDKIARSMTKAGEYRDYSLEELVSFGYTGLISAATRFNPKLGYDFHQYANPRI